MHYLTIVILPSTINNILDEVTKLLLGSESDTNKFFPKHEVRCNCLNFIARSNSFAKFDSSPEGVELMRLLRKSRQDQDRLMEEELLSRRAKSVLEIEQTHPAYMQIDKDCDTCLGTGFFQESRDPRGHWDYWHIGGRWSGLLSDSSVNPLNIDEKWNHNIAKVSLLPEDLPIAVIVTPEGYWYESHISPGEFSPMELAYDFEFQAQEDWKNEVNAFKQKFHDHYAVLVDCHF